MNTAYPTVTSHESPTQQSEKLHEVRRVGLIDRIALHVGVALIKWGRRPFVAESRERRANRIEQHVAQLARERSYERQIRLSIPVR